MGKKRDAASNRAPRRDPVAFGSAFLAACALTVSAWQGFEIRRHSRLSARPYIDISTILNQESNRYGLRIANEGLGPAIMKDLRLTVDGVDVAQDHRNGWKEALEKLDLERDPFVYRVLQQENLIPQGQENPLFGFASSRVGDEDLSEKLRVELQRKLRRLIVRICYCSIYEECFELIDGYNVSPGSKRTEVSSCQNSI